MILSHNECQKKQIWIKNTASATCFFISLSFFPKRYWHTLNANKMCDRSERLAKYNQLLRIEEELGTNAKFAGANFRKVWGKVCCGKIGVSQTIRRIYMFGWPRIFSPRESKELLSRWQLRAPTVDYLSVFPPTPCFSSSTPSDSSVLTSRRSTCVLLNIVNLAMWSVYYCHQQLLFKS